MTVEEAIKILNDLEGLGKQGATPDVDNAIKLGIEALKLNLAMRETYAHPELLTLPSEREGEHEQH